MPLARLAFGRTSVTIIALGMIVVVCVLAAATDEGRAITSAAFSGNGRELRHVLLGLGVLGALALLAVILTHAVIPFPSELVMAAAGYVYGFALALPMMLLFWLLSALLAYRLAARLGRPLAKRVVGAERLTRGEDLVARGGAGALLATRMIPLIPFNAICYAAGIARVPVRRYAWTTLLGMVPLSVFMTYLGSRLESPRLDDPRLWAAVIGLVGLVIGGQYLGRRLRGRPDAH